MSDDLDYTLYTHCPQCRQEHPDDPVKGMCVITCIDLSDGSISMVCATHTDRTVACLPLDPRFVKFMRARIAAQAAEGKMETVH